jgi:hypothetical protein
MRTVSTTCCGRKTYRGDSFSDRWVFVGLGKGLFAPESTDAATESAAVCKIRRTPRWPDERAAVTAHCMASNAIEGAPAGTPSHD